MLKFLAVAGVAILAITATPPPAEAASFASRVAVDRNRDAAGDSSRLARRTAPVGELRDEKKVARLLFSLPLTAEVRAAADSGSQVRVVVQVKARSHLRGNRLVFHSWPGRTTSRSAPTDYGRAGARSPIRLRTSERIVVDVTSVVRRAPGASIVLRARLAKNRPRDGRRNVAKVYAKGGRRPAIQVVNLAAISALEGEVISLVNAVRATGHTCTDGAVFAPAPPLAAENRIGAAARAHSEWMAAKPKFQHTGAGGSSVGDRLTTAGYGWSRWAENIAAGHSSAAGTVVQWLESPPHCHNLMSPQVTETGVGYAHDPAAPYRHYWTHDFARPAG